MKHIKTFESFINEGSIGDYYDTFEEAMDDVQLGMEAEGLTFDEKEWTKTVEVGKKPPRPGETFETSIPLYKNGRKAKQMVHIQVYNRGTGTRPFELTYHISI